MTNLLHLVLLALALRSAFAENPIRFAGSTAGARPLWTPPRIFIEDSTSFGVLFRDVECFSASDAQPFVMFTANFTTPGLRSFTALGAGMTIEFLIYDALPGLCKNLVYAKGWPGGYRVVAADPHIDFMFFNATTYYFVVTGGPEPWSADGGDYAVNIEPMNATGNISSVAMWRPPAVSDAGQLQFGGFSFDYDCVQDNSTAYTEFTRYTWTQDVAGKFDVYLFLEPPAWIRLDSTFVLYEGTPTDAALSSNSCKTGATFIVSGRILLHNAGAMIPSVSLRAGVVYSLVFSNSEAIHWGVRIVPTRVAQLVPSGFTQPVRTNGGICEPSSVVNSPWYSFQVTSAVQRLYLCSISQWLGTWSDSYYIFVYDGLVSIPQNTCPPTPTLLHSFAVVATNITVVIVPGSNATNISVPFLINFLTGDQLGSSIAPTSGTLSGTTALASASSSSSSQISTSSTSATSISSSSSTSAVASSSSTAALSTTGSTTPGPTTPRPTTRKPTTRKPTTRKPTTRKPTTRKPTTRKPTTHKPTTHKPTPRA